MVKQCYLQKMSNELPTRLLIMYIETDSGILNLDHVILVKIDHQTLAKDDRYKLHAITANIYEKYRQSYNIREHHVAHKPAEIAPHSVQITQGTLADCENQFDKIAEQDNFIQFTKKEHQNEYPRLLNLEHIISIDINEPRDGQDDYLEIIVNTFYSGSSKLRRDYSSCHFPSLSPYELRFSNYHGHNCKEIIDAIKRNISIL